MSKGFQHQFWQAVKKGAEEEAAKQGARITFEGPATEADVEAQVTMLTNALAKKPAAIGFAALDSKAAAPLLQQAKSAKIPVIAFDSGVDSDIPVTTASTDNKAAAAEAAKHMSDLLGGKGKVALVVHDQTSRSGIDRRDGFLEWMKANAPGITVLPPQYGGGDQAKSADITKSIIAANPDIAGIYGSNEGSAIGVIKGVEESGKKGIKIVGFDSGKAQIDAIKNGTMAGAITQNPIGIGQQLVIAAMKAIKGENQPKVIDTGFYWYDKTNIDKPEIAAVLYQ
ncbi:ABC transporter substrate-binding protein [Micromonospora globispora]|uniref:ABC transporter substrate-binding protein n=1 Tax=Micromonospora globispora TaxID=1450148 RepID=UPI001FAF7819|nr:ABC transporter substrate-binding protein [Micromonospora globispora]